MTPPLPCAYCDSPDGSKWHRTTCSEAAGAPLREALLGRIAEELDAHGLGPHSKPSECQAGAVLNEVRALAATPAPAPLDVERLRSAMALIINLPLPEIRRLAPKIAAEYARLTATPAPAPLDVDQVKVALKADKTVRALIRFKGHFNEAWWDRFAEELLVGLTARAAATEDTDAHV